MSVVCGPCLFCEHSLRDNTKRATSNEAMKEDAVPGTSISLHGQLFGISGSGSLPLDRVSTIETTKQVSGESLALLVIWVP